MGAQPRVDVMRRDLVLHLAVSFTMPFGMWLMIQTAKQFGEMVTVCLASVFVILFKEVVDPYIGGTRGADDLAAGIVGLAVGMVAIRLMGVM